MTCNQCGNNYFQKYDFQLVAGFLYATCYDCREENFKQEGSEERKRKKLFKTWVREDGFVTPKPKEMCDENL